MVHLDRQRAEAETRRISYQPNMAEVRYIGRHRPNEPGMTTDRVRRILDGDESAPPGWDRATVEAIRSVMSKVNALDALTDWW